MSNPLISYSCQIHPVRCVTLGLLHNFSGPCKNKTGSQGLGLLSLDSHYLIWS